MRQKARGLKKPLPFAFAYCLIVYRFLVCALKCSGFDVSTF